jgi:hypothetical protein
MSTVDVATLKARAEEFVAKAIAGEATLIEQNGKRAVLLPCQGTAPDFELDPEKDRLLRQRAIKGGAFAASSQRHLLQARACCRSSAG